MSVQEIPVDVLAPAVVITGLVVVFTALLGLWLVVAVFGRIFSAAGNAKKSADAPAKAVPAVRPAPAPVVEEGISPEVVAAIAAAVASMDGNYSLRTVKRARKAANAWKQAGVLQNTQPF